MLALKNKFPQATVKVEMSDGGKTIISQHHASDTGTISKVYVSDTDESGFNDSVAGNGIFDVYVRLRNTSGNEEKFALGTITSGESFNLRVVNNYGDVDVSALGNSFGIPKVISFSIFLSLNFSIQR